MSFDPGTHLGRYEIVRRLGGGGMGEVYAAHDTRLGRDVAVKVLLAAFSKNDDWRRRFDREARTISALTHPHICAVHDVGETDGTPYIVMEQIVGETLATRLHHGKLPVRDVLRYAIQIASALECAHEHGIIHRDLKPSNVMITSTGAKLLDFGLAKWTGVERALSETITEPLLGGESTILGTLAYMAPEQLEGKEPDARADIFSFGAVLYEMITGRRAFEGTSRASIIAAILERTPPDPSSLHSDIPPALDHILRRCLAKTPRMRWQTMLDLVQELDWVAESSGATAAAKPQMKSRWVTAAGSVVVVLAATGFLITFARRDDRPPRSVTRLAVIPPRGATVTGIAISPDSRRMVLTLTVDGVSSLYLRDLESLDSRALAGTTNGSQPFWSPDSSSIGFFADGKLKRIDLNGGAVRSLANAGQPRGGDWGSSGTIVFSPSTEDAIYAVSADGGPMRAVTPYVRDGSQRSQRFPSMLPDGEHFVYFSMEERRNGIYIASVHGGAPRWVTDSDTGAVYSSENLYFVRQGVFSAQRFDAVKGQLVGMATSLGDRPAWGIPFGTPGFSVARDGTLAYQSGSVSQLRWFSRGGKQIGSVGNPSKFISAVNLSADDGRVAVSRFDHSDGDIWVYDLGRNTTTHLVHSPLTEFSPFWSKDGRFILFARSRGRTTEFVRRSATDEGPEEILATAKSVRGLYDWSTDGRFAIYTREGKATNDDVYALPLDGAGEPIAIANSEFSESWGRLSPDGRWVAYTSDETGREEVYVQSFPHRARRWQVSVDGASRPRWRRDGKELVFVARDGSVTAIALNATRLPFDGAIPRRLFDAPGDIGDYDLTADGQRFLMSVRDSDVGRPAVIVLSGWQPGRRV